MSEGSESVEETKLNEKIEAIFEMFQVLDEKITKIDNNFNRLRKELGYK